MKCRSSLTRFPSHAATIVLCAGWLLLVTIAVSGEITIKPAHRKSELKELAFVDCIDGNARFAAKGACRSRVVVQCDGPLRIRSLKGAIAKLSAGWDGTVGYSQYLLQLDVPGPGDVEVQLETAPVPAAPVPTTEEDLRQFATDMRDRPSRFPDGPQAFREWQAKYRVRLAERLMSKETPTRAALDPKIIETKDHDSFVLERVAYQSRQDRRNVLLVSRPKGKRQAPILLALHGHEATWGGADERAYQPNHADDFIGYFAERGWVVVQPATMKHELQSPDWTLQGEWTWDALVALDYAFGLPDVDTQRAAVCGLSTGAHLAMNVLALDDRVQAGVVGCILSSWHHLKRRCRVPPHCDCGICDQLNGVLEQCDWAALAAPKSVQFQHGRQDASSPGADDKLLKLNWNTGVMPAAEFDTIFGEVRRAYRAAGRPQATEYILHDGAHKIDNESAYRWLNTWAEKLQPKDDVESR